MGITTMGISTKLATAAAAVAMLAGGVAAATPAQAAVIETDAVNTMYHGNGVKGTIYWRNYNDGFAQVTLYNVDDGYCVVLQHRVLRGGVWGPWDDMSYCKNTTYPLNLWTGNTGQRITSWQIRTRPAWTSTWTYDTNAPGGA